MRPPHECSSLCFPMTAITTACNATSGGTADLGCGSGRRARRCKSSRHAGGASLPEDAGACHQGSTPRSAASSAGTQHIPAAPSGIFGSEEFRAGGGDPSCQSSAPPGTGGLCSGTAESCRAMKGLGNSAHPRGPCWAGVRISTGPPCPRNTQI